MVAVRHLTFPLDKNHFPFPFTEFYFTGFCSFSRVKYHAALASGCTELGSCKFKIQFSLTGLNISASGPASFTLTKPHIASTVILKTAERFQNGNLFCFQNRCTKLCTHTSHPQDNPRIQRQPTFTDEESMQRDKFLPTYIFCQPPMFQLRGLCKHPVRKPLLSHLLEKKAVREDCLPQTKISLHE